MVELVQFINYEVIPTDHSKTYVAVEEEDRLLYSPRSHESARIQSLEPLDGYHGPTHGNYYLTVETYASAEDAKRRAEEYLDLGRLAAASAHDENALSKMTVRCWGYAHEEKAYLLTTHAAMYSALEAKVGSVKAGLGRALKAP